MGFLFGVLLEHNEKRNFAAACRKISNKNPTILFICLSLMSAYSEAIPILGPKEEYDSIEKIASVKRETFGPTTKANTLWGVAKRITPKETSIYKSMGAIYRLNPKAFENDNIHVLIPGSVLIMPTIKEIQNEKVIAVSRRLLQDEKLLPKKTQISAVKKTTKDKDEDEDEEKVISKEKTNTKEDKKNQQSSTSDEAVVKNLASVQSQKNEHQTPFKKSEQTALDSFANSNNEDSVFSEKKITMLIQEQIDTTNQDITKLLENNHALKLKMADIQNELAMVREKQINDEPLNQEIRQFLDTERLRAEQEKNQSSFFEKLLNNPWLLFALSILPALFLILGFVLFTRYKKNKQNEAQEQDILQKIEVMDENSNKQHFDNNNLAPELEDSDEDEELNLETAIDADELFKHNQATPEKKAESDTIKYVELNQIAKEAKGYANTVQNNENDLEINETQTKQQVRIASTTVETQQAEIAKEKDKYIPSIVEDNNETAIDEKAEAKPIEDTDISALSFPTVDEISLDDLGEFEENDAFYAALAEQSELEAFLKEKESDNTKSKAKVLLSDDEANLMAGLDMDALLASSFEDDFTQSDNIESKKMRAAIQSQLAKEDWSKQPDLSDEEFARMFDETEKLIESSKKEGGKIEGGNGFGNEQSSDFSSLLANVDLDDFDEGIEVKLETMDLAKAYIEMNDLEAAIPLLNELLENEDAKLRQEAQGLLEKLKKD